MIKTIIKHWVLAAALTVQMQAQPQVPGNIPVSSVNEDDQMLQAHQRLRALLSSAPANYPVETKAEQTAAIEELKRIISLQPKPFADPGITWEDIVRFKNIYDSLDRVGAGYLDRIFEYDGLDDNGETIKVRDTLLTFAIRSQKQTGADSVSEYWDPNRAVLIDFLLGKGADINKRLADGYSSRNEVAYQETIYGYCVQYGLEKILGQIFVRGARPSTRRQLDFMTQDFRTKRRKSIGEQFDSVEMIKARVSHVMTILELTETLMQIEANAQTCGVLNRPKYCNVGYIENHAPR
jgi:hypothetical protein